MDRKEPKAVLPRPQTPRSSVGSADRRDRIKKQTRPLGKAELPVRSRGPSADALCHGQPATSVASNEQATNFPFCSSPSTGHIHGGKAGHHESTAEEGKPGLPGILKDDATSALPILTSPTHPKGRKDKPRRRRSSSCSTQSWPPGVPSAWKYLFLEPRPPKGIAAGLADLHHPSRQAQLPSPGTKCESEDEAHTSRSLPVLIPRRAYARSTEGPSRSVLEATNPLSSGMLPTPVGTGYQRPALSGHPERRTQFSKGAIAMALDEERAMRKAARSPDCDASEDERLLWKKYFHTVSPLHGISPRFPVPPSSPMSPLSGAMSLVRRDLKPGDSSKEPGVSDSFGPRRFSTIIVIAAFGVLSVMVTWLIWFRHGLRPEPLLCLTDDCRKHADYLAVHVDYSVPPCQDFKRHICSSWKPPTGYSDVFSTTQSIVTLRWVRSFDKFLDDAVTSSALGKKPRAIFQACIAKRMDTQSEADSFLSFLAERNLSWPQLPSPGRSALGVLIYLALNWRQTSWLTLRFHTDKKANSGRRRILMAPGNTDVLMYLATNYFRLQRRNEYRQYWMVHYKTLYGETVPAASAQQIDASGTVFISVVKLLLDAITREPKVPLQTRLHQIGDYTGRLTSSHWVEQLNLHVSDGSTFTGEDEVLVSDRLFLETIGRLFSRYSDPQLIREMTWEFVQVHIAVVDAERVAMAMAGREYVEAYIHASCAFIVDEIYRPLLASLFVALRRTSGDARLITAGLGSIVRKAIDRVNSSWLSDDSKMAAVQKYGAMRIGFWPPDISDERVEKAYRCFPTREKLFVLFWISAQECLWRMAGTLFDRITSNLSGLISSSLADYDYLTNTVNMAVTALADPLYYTRGTRAMFYAGIGFLFATQMMKVQDMTGIKVLTNGSIADGSWLLKPDRERFEVKRRCLGANHDGYLVPAIAALEVTYAAFTDDGGVDSARRPITENMTEDQVFFSTVCEMTCYTENNPWLPTTDCNVLVRNSRSFADAYHCPPGSPMNPEEKCGFFD